LCQIVTSKNGSIMIILSVKKTVDIQVNWIDIQNATSMEVKFYYAFDEI